MAPVGCVPSGHSARAGAALGAEQLEGGWNPLVVEQVEEHTWEPPVLVPRVKEESCEVCGAGKTELLLGKCLSPRREWPPCSAPQVQGPPGSGPASEHPGCSSGPGLLGRGWDTQVQLDLERVTVCVNALGWTLEIQEPPCHIWVSPCRSFAGLRWMSLELVVACR